LSHPACFRVPLYAALVALLVFDYVESQVANDGEVIGCFADSDAGLVCFDAPVEAHAFGRALGGAMMGAGDDAAGFGESIVSDLRGAANHDDGGICQGQRRIGEWLTRRIRDGVRL